MNEAGVIYPHQLFANHPVVQAKRLIYLVEDPLYFCQYPFHRQKLMLHRASMKRFADQLTKAKKPVRYIEAHTLRSSSDLGRILKEDGIAKLYVVEPNDHDLEKAIKKGFRGQITFLSDPDFLTRLDQFEEWVGQKSKLFFTSFYIAQRKRLGILLDEHGGPWGGKWSFDTENRSKLPKGVSLPKVPIAKIDTYAEEARAYVSTRFPHAIGDDRDLLYPSSRDEAKRWLTQFVEERLDNFGIYEDAIAKNQNVLFHSCITPMLNIGLLSPQQVVDCVLAKFQESKNSLPINSVEGYIRQVIGWREFIRGVYGKLGTKQRTTNFWNHARAIPRSFYEGTTGIEPVDTVIRRFKATGYVHHIERLMILGNFLLLCEFDPDAIYRWFMEFSVDGYDWVMVPNVYGMSQHADGGLMTTKPYISGSSYVLKMSDFPRGPWCEIWDALYWHFMAKHRSFFERNPRMSVMTKQLDKMGSKLKTHKTTAEQFFQSLVEPQP